MLYIYKIETPILSELILPNLKSTTFNIETIYDNKLTSYFYVFLSVISIFLGVKTFKKNSVKERKNMTFILVFMILNGLYLLISKNSILPIQNYEVVIINKSLLIGYILINIKNKWYSELFFLLIIVIEIINFLL